MKACVKASTDESTRGLEGGKITNQQTKLQLLQSGEVYNLFRVIFAFKGPFKNKITGFLSRRLHPITEGVILIQDALTLICHSPNV